MRHPINQKLVPVMTAVNRKAGVPSAVMTLLHLVGRRIPPIEVAHNRDLLRLGGGAQKIYRNYRVLCRITLTRRRAIPMS